MENVFTVGYKIKKPAQTATNKSKVRISEDGVRSARKTLCQS